MLTHPRPITRAKRPGILSSSRCRSSSPQRTIYRTVSTPDFHHRRLSVRSYCDFISSSSVSFIKAQGISFVKTVFRLPSGKFLQTLFLRRNGLVAAEFIQKSGHIVYGSLAYHPGIDAVQHSYITVLAFHRIEFHNTVGISIEVTVLHLEHRFAAVLHFLGIQYGDGDQLLVEGLIGIVIADFLACAGLDGQVIGDIGLR